MSTPAVEVRSFAVTIPAGTAISNPLVTSISFPPRVVSGVHWKVPPGPSGLMGWKLTMSDGNAVLPTGGGYIITDNDSDTWPLQGQPDSGQWELTGYNADIYDHTVYVDFLLDLVGAGTTSPQLISNQAVTGAAGLAPEAITTPPPLTVPAITTPAAVTVPAITTAAPAITGV